jgi:hypothetical protein
MSMNRRPAALLALLSALAAADARADDAALKACRQVADAARRLACYDALPLAAPAATPAPPAAAAPAAVAAPAAPAAAQFGIEERSRPEPPAAIESHIVGRFEGWEPRDRIKLANGQVWQIADDSRGVLYKNDPKVRVRRGALGAFYLELEGTNRSPRVIRVE